jgi:ectoine hydroxylase
MHPSCLQHRLTADEHAFFNANGYLVIENALDQSQVQRLIGIVDRVDARERAPGQRSKPLSVTNIIHEDNALVDLLDCPAVFPKVWGILGWNIYLYHSHLDVAPPADEAALRSRVAWHQDSMRVNDEIETHPRPRLSLKVGY